MDAQFGRDVGEEVEDAETVALVWYSDAAPTALDLLLKNERKKLLYILVDRLPNHRELVIQYYGLNGQFPKTPQEIADEMGGEVDRRTIHMRIKYAVRQLRRFVELLQIDD
jgi:DNA-directed RNA polymerase specialized sigma24 family protein